MPPPPKNQNKRDFPGRRWLSISLRSLHLVGVVLLGVALLAGGDRQAAGSLVLATGVQQTTPKETPKMPIGHN